MKYGVAFVGTGYMAGKHAAALRDHPQARLISALSRSPSSRTQAFAEAHGFERVEGDIDELLADGDVDIVFICSPDATHSDYVTRALTAGKHVMCEKPLALTEAEFAQIEACLDQSPGVLQVGMNCRFRGQYLDVQKRVGRHLGDLRFLRGTYIVNAVEAVRTDTKPWQREFPAGYLPFLYGGVLHCLDLLRWIGGPIGSVFARGAAHELEGEWGLDTFSVSLAFASGAIGELTASASAFRPAGFTLEAWMSEGAVVDGREYRRVGDLVDSNGIELPVEQPKIDVALQFEDMVAAIETGRNPLNSAAEAHHNFRVLSAINRSVTEERPTTVDGIDSSPQDRIGDLSGNS